jgi:hypothetical protein
MTKNIKNFYNRDLRNESSKSDDEKNEAELPEAKFKNNFDGANIYHHATKLDGNSVQRSNDSSFDFSAFDEFDN